MERILNKIIFYFTFVFILEILERILNKPLSMNKKLAFFSALLYNKRAEISRLR